MLCAGARSAEAFFADVKPRQQNLGKADVSAAEVAPEAEADWTHRQPATQPAMSQKDILEILSGERILLFIHWQCHPSSTFRPSCHVKSVLAATLSRVLLSM